MEIEHGSIRQRVVPALTSALFCQLVVRLLCIADLRQLLIVLRSLFQNARNHDFFQINTGGQQFVLFLTKDDGRVDSRRALDAASHCDGLKDRCGPQNFKRSRLIDLAKNINP